MLCSVLLSTLLVAPLANAIPTCAWAETSTNIRTETFGDLGYTEENQKYWYGISVHAFPACLFSEF
jgi:hypothetical protein